MNKSEDVENPELNEEIKGFHFSEATIRRAFVRKVYMILLLQVLLTCVVSALFTYHDGVKLFVLENPSIVLISLISGFIMLFVLACCDVVRRKHPMNLIFLAIFTLTEAVVIGFVCCISHKEYVLIAVGLTALVCFSLTVFAFQSKYDFTGSGPYLLIFMIVLMFSSILLVIFPNKLAELIYSSCAVILFSFYLVFDTQLMLGGHHKYSISPEEHIFAALNLYLDIINIFIHILSLLGSANN